jgi:Holliday junction DNA helicase RuvA
MALGGAASEPAEPSVVDDADIATKPKAKAKSKTDDGAAAAAANARADALSALVNLGYHEGEAATAVAMVEAEGVASDANALIKAALKALARNI